MAEVCIDVKRLKRELRRSEEIGETIYEDDEIEITITARRKAGSRG